MGVIVTHICIVTFDTIHLSLPRVKSLYKTFCYRLFPKKEGDNPQVSVDLFSLHNLSGYLYII